MMPSWFQILIVVVLIVLLFGRGKISDLMGDVAKGIKSFKKGMAEDDTASARQIDHESGETIDTASSKTAENTKAG